MLYANKHRWVKRIHPDILPDFGKSGIKKISQLLAKLGDTNISYKFSPLDEDFFTWFTPQYEKQVGSKKNFSGHNVIAKTLHRENKIFPYFSLTVFESDTPVGGVIFTLRKNRLSIAFRVFKPSWDKNPTVRCSPALLAEYLLARHALDNNLEYLAHGVDKNPYGLNASIGLAIFKLSVGCRPEIYFNHEIKDFNTAEYSTDTLVFEYKTGSKVIEEATLMTTLENLPKYEQLMKYEHLLKIKTVLMELNQVSTN
ncbi:hypothetical protein A3I99_00045 [Candidatus Kaiserbacteria bacterium RIFCSPLOWO2_02_FULL_45_11b]|uniref:Uncharacterized protein n=1 Tax=Candidatus Kaiserbacteria bacterium RIFCSPLOWO2_12_FULL_45_26 TaxID=1798525 RepID=A0A1F6FGI1_9BACT|nr:MAG: hypothetical protein A2Z56_02905 [Candidatus Kaiserbacteria bacterium RIFCSPHIGHO2_12_45_16]OGG71041.1 MAG: hypothetical protein A2929_01795 [Candidatus Kaiserbacteria bacterium RIFCSPLOWO2_01_FULL_45_25]OGG84180.1 MAG: hypothetical protein A3I99_00045 [Candidatus Kaiserbacteria bacterium RIFCSPLOWO2_02_FULL_45_11b]OGG84967.1 MAG: hypothetical protein A3G90_02785 [Candidatus Kaiserbacteria bacterium RIFCSPLOWO2_12_FULL_45_26]